MRQNQKLTNVLHGKVVAALETSPGQVLIRFQDGVTMAIVGDVTGDIPTGSMSGGVEVVRDDQHAMTIELDTGSTLRFVVGDPGGSVTVRDAGRTLLYAG